MSHNIYAVIIRTRDIHKGQEKMFRDTKSPEYKIIAVEDAIDRHVTLPEQRVQLMTSYHGGAGDQMATYFDGTVKREFDDSVKGGAINTALMLLGVEEKAEEDRFDQLGLGSFRSNHDLRIRRVAMDQDDHGELLGTLEDLSNWRAIIRMKKERPPTSEFTEQDMKEMEGLAAAALTLARKSSLI